MAGDFIARHLRACDGFSMVVDGAGDRWSSPSPCSGWDAGAVVEHVIGFHDVLLLRPLGSKHHLPKGEPTVRWAATVTRVGSAVLDAPEDVILPGPGGSEMALPLLLPMLTTEVLLHTWDLAKAVGQPVSLDVELCERAYEGAKLNEEALRSSGMFAPPVPVSDDADVATKLVALLGRRPRLASAVAHELAATVTLSLRDE